MEHQIVSVGPADEKRNAVICYTNGVRCLLNVETLKVVDVIRSPIEACIHHNADSDGDKDQDAWSVLPFQHDYNQPDFEVTHYCREETTEVFGVKIRSNIAIVSLIENTIISYFVVPSAHNLFDMTLSNS